MKDAAIKIFLVILAVFAPAKAMVLSSLTLILLDMFTGVWAAYKEGEAITSAGLRRTISKLLVYESALLIAFLAQQYLTGPDIPVANMAAGFIGLTETLSCLENVNRIGGGELLKSLIDKLGSVNK